MIIYIAIGNSDDKLTQREWANFHGAMYATIHASDDIKVHGEWFSSPTSAWQNACWCLEITDESVFHRLRNSLRFYARRFNQDSIAWTEAKPTEFLTPSDPGVI